MFGDALLRELILTYALALVLIVALARLRIPPVVALIATGAIAGPGGIRIVPTQEDVQLLAEIGIVLLLFTVGLDFSLGDFRRVWRRVIGAGVLQIGVTAAIVVAVVLAVTDRPLPLALFAGLFVALSSTAIVLKELGGRNQLDAPHGRLVVGILLFQDLCVVALLLLVPILSGQTPLDAVPLAIGRALLAMAAVFLVSRFALPLLLGAVARSGRREAFSLAVVVASVGTGWISSLFGTSMALGAFLGGLCLAESEFSHQAHAEIRPIRDLLASLFFVSLGMLLDGAFLVQHWPMVARDDGVHPAAESRRGDRRPAARRDAASRGCGRGRGALAGRRILVRVRTLGGRSRAGLCIGLADPARSEHRDDGRDARDDWRGAGNFPPPHG